MAIPANISTGRVTGQFVVGVVDGVDADDEPDFIPAQGSISFTASTPYLPNRTATPNPVTMLKTTIRAVLDDEGYLCTPNPQSPTIAGKRGVRLVATNDPDTGVEGWTWNATPNFTDVNGTRLTDAIKTFDFALPSGSTVDLTTVVRVPASQGIGVPQAEAAAAAAQDAATKAAADAKAAAADAKAAAGAAKATDSNVSDLVGTDGTETNAAVARQVENAVAPKLDAEEAVRVFQSAATLDAAAAAKVKNANSALREAVDARALAAASTKMDSGQAADTFQTKTEAARLPARLEDATTAEGKAVSARTVGDAGNSTSPLRQVLSGAYASTALFDRKRTPRPPMTILQGMDAGHSVTVPATTGTVNLNDTTDFALGDRSVSVTTPGDGNLFNMLRITGQELNMTGKGIIVWLKLINAQNLRGWFMDIGDSTFTNFYRAQMNLPNGGKSPLFEGEWVPLWLPFSVFNYAKTGTPSKASITSVRMYFGDAGPGAPVTLKFGGLAAYSEGISRYPNGVASFTFDDSSLSQATFGAPYLAKYGFAGTMFPILDRIGTPGNYSIAQLRHIVDALGFELGAHASNAANHVSVVGRSQEDLESEFRKIRQWCFDNGFPSAMSYAYPIGPFDKQAVESVRKYFGYGRTNDGKNTSPTSPHRYSASAFVCGAGPASTLAKAKEAIDLAVADKTWVNFVVHGLVTSAPGSNDWLQSDFAALVDYCAAVGIQCAPAGDVIAVL